MLGRQDDTHPAAFQPLLQESRDLLTELLLYLHARREGLHGPGQLRQTGDPSSGQHADVRDP